MSKKVSVFWFRRDLRLDDNVGFYNALSGNHPVLPIFIFDSEILDKLPKDDARVSFIHQTLQKMRERLLENGSSLALYFGKPLEVFKDISEAYELQSVYTNHDYEPYARERDETVSDYLSEQNIGFKTFKDQVIYEKSEVVKDDGDPYVVYTPYMKKWKERFQSEGPLKEFSNKSLLKNLIQTKQLPNLSLADIKFEAPKITVPPYDDSRGMVQDYEKTRNFPSKQGTSRLGPYLRFGLVSIRKVMATAINEKNEVFWNQLIWREFFMQILWHFPRTANEAFKPKYDRIDWRNNEEEFSKWMEGKTGYPLVDAGMRQLNTTGYMHNRVRMLTASFLSKHLLIDWRWGEAYFAEKLLDYEMASNVGSWQWAAGTGVDAAPYFRIFNPSTQLDKFDKDRSYTHKYIPELETDDYPKPIVDHKEARERCLKTYKEALD